MSEDGELLKKRFLELYRKSDMHNIYCFTDFLGLMERSVLTELRSMIPKESYTEFGGADGAERVIVRFGREDELGYSEGFPILCLKITPKNVKFADKLTHRDYLGALMNLGIERSVIGDIVIRESTAFLFCKESIAEYIRDSLTKIKHTDVSVSDAEELPAGELYRTERKTVQANGERLDAVVAKIFSLSRDDSLTLFKRSLVFADGRLISSASYIPKTDEIISVRGFGRFIYRGYQSLTKKGKKNIVVDLYI